MANYGQKRTLKAVEPAEPFITRVISIWNFSKKSYASAFLELLVFPPQKWENNRKSS